VNPTRWFGAVLALLAFVGFVAGGKSLSPGGGASQVLGGPTQANPLYPDQGTGPALNPGPGFGFGEVGPFLTVTPNGPADGGDYGGNTPGTKSGGVYEGVMAGFSRNLPVRIGSGHYSIASDTPWTYCGTVTIIHEGNSAKKSDIYALLPLPVGPAQPYIHRIAGSGGLYGEGESGVVLTSSTQGITIVDASGVTTPLPSPLAGSAYAWGFVFAPARLPTSGNTSTGIDISGMVFLCPDYNTSPQVGSVYAWASYNSRCEDVAQLPIGGSTATVGAPTSAFAPAFVLDGYFGDECWVNLVYAQRMPCGFIFGDHVAGGTIVTQSNYYGAITAYSGGHWPVIQRFDCQKNIFNIGLSSSGIRIVTLDGEDPGGDTTTADVDVGLGADGLSTDDPWIVIHNFLMEASGTATGYRLPEIQLNGNTGPFLKVSSIFFGGVPTLALSANPPTSGTTYVNPYPFDLDLYVPVTFAASESSTFSASIGPDSTTANEIIDDSEPSQVTGAVTRTYLVHLPAGWYYSFAVAGSGSSIGTVVIVRPGT
jgi:hypothetical protein